MAVQGRIRRHDLQAIKRLSRAIVFSCLLAAVLTFISCKKEKQWVQYYKDSANALYYYDTKSIYHLSNKLVSVRVWVSYSGNNLLEKESVNLMEIDCFQKMQRAAELRTLLRDGRSIRTPGTSWRNIRPGTAGEALEKNICYKY